MATEFATAPTTELEAVNRLLRCIGEAPVNSITASDNPDVESAKQHVSDTLRAVLEEGWSFNEEDGTLDPDPTTGVVVIPHTTLRVRPTGCDALCGYVQRDGKLYDRNKRTFNIARSVRVKLTLMLEFNMLPQAARWLITVSAARRFASDELNSPVAFRFTQADEDAAREAMEHAEDMSSEASAEFVSPFFAKMLLNLGRR